nr:MAG TPA: hypothetical protein [Caudoviricetes sp.]
MRSVRKVARYKGSLREILRKVSPKKDVAMKKK